MNSGHVHVSELTVCRDSVETPAVRHGLVKSGTVSLSRCLHIFLPLPTEKSEIKTQKGQFDPDLEREWRACLLLQSCQRIFHLFLFYLF